MSIKIYEEIRRSNYSQLKRRLNDVKDEDEEMLVCLSLLEHSHKSDMNKISKTGDSSFARPWFGQLMTGPQLIAYLIGVDMWLKE